MDVDRMSLGDKIVAASAIALLLIMFIFKWFGLEVDGGDTLGFSAADSKNAWGSFSVIDIVLFLTVIAALAMAYIHASRTQLDLPVALSVIVAALGVLSTLLILFRLLSPPDFGAPGGIDFDEIGVSKTREIGAFLGLLAAAGIAYGGFRRMQEEGTSFQAEGDRLRSSGGDGPGSRTTGTGTTGTGTTGTSGTGTADTPETRGTGTTGTGSSSVDPPESPRTR